MADTKPTNGADANAPAATPGASNVEQPGPKLTPAELKKKAKDEKAARRAAEKQQKTGTGSGAAATDAAGPSVRAEAVAQGEEHSKKAVKQPQQEQKPQQPDSKSSAKQMPTRRRPSQSTPSAAAPTQGTNEPKAEQSKQVGFFSHLYNQQQRRGVIEGASKDVHPAILSLALQTSSYVICGSQARCVSMLLALKDVISSYTTPQGTALPRHLSTHALSPQLAHLKSHGRPFSTSQSNAIRWLKNIIAKLDPSLPENSAKQQLLREIDTFIRERFTVADHVIAEAVADEHIGDGDTIVVFAKSAVVTEALSLAIRKGRRFRILITDSRPLFEGQALLRRLKQVIAAVDGRSRVQLSYCLVAGLATVLATAEPTKCILGAHAILNDGQLYSRAGTALVAMLSRERQPRLPVIVCAESIKLTERVALDSIVSNELAPEHELVGRDSESPMKNWREMENMYIANPLYDVTPVSLLSTLVTELGSVPPSSAPVVQRMTAGAGEGIV